MEMAHVGTGRMRTFTEFHIMVMVVNTYGTHFLGTMVLRMVQRKDGMERVIWEERER